jgi:hypothetical protein
VDGGGRGGGAVHHVHGGIETLDRINMIYEKGKVMLFLFRIKCGVKSIGNLEKS